jgi:uncharacterized protein (TIGR03067 family)
MKTLRILTVMVASAGWLVGAGAWAQKSGDSSGPAAQELKRLQGTWKAVGSQFAGQSQGQAKNKNANKNRLQGLTCIVSDDSLTIQRFENVEGRYTFSVDPTKTPHHIDQISSDGKTYHGIYRVTDTTLTICLPTDPTEPRPRQFATRAGDGHVLRIYKKVKGDLPANPSETPTPKAPGR